jgi:hypothetical protein
MFLVTVSPLGAGAALVDVLLAATTGFVLEIESGFAILVLMLQRCRYR